MRHLGTAGMWLLAGGLLAGCAVPGTQPSTGSTLSPPAASTPAPTAVPTGAPTGSAPAAGEIPATEPAGDTGDDAAAPRCTTPELTLSLGAGDAGAGSQFVDLVFTNVSTHTCELHGFPGVSYVTGDDGHQVGPAAAQAGDRGGQVPIAAGQTARAALKLVNVQNYDPAVCAPTPVQGLRVYPPGDTASLFVAREGIGCTQPPPGDQLSVQTITP